MTWQEPYPLPANASEREMIEWLQELSQRLGGKTPTMVEIAPFHMRFVRKFGTLRQAQKAAGLAPNARRGWNHKD